MIARHPQLMAELNAAFSRKTDSLIQYILDARPYLRPGDEKCLPVLKILAGVDRDAASALARVIERLGGIPQVESPNPDYAHLNYLALDYLLRILVGDLEDQLVRDQQALQMAAEEPLAQEVLNQLIDITSDQLQRVKAMSIVH